MKVTLILILLSSIAYSLDHECLMLHLPADYPYFNEKSPLPSDELSRHPVAFYGEIVGNTINLEHKTVCLKCLTPVETKVTFHLKVIKAIKGIESTEISAVYYADGDCREQAQKWRGRVLVFGNRSDNEIIIEPPSFWTDVFSNIASLDKEVVANGTRDLIKLRGTEKERKRRLKIAYTRGYIFESMKRKEKALKYYRKAEMLAKSDDESYVEIKFRISSLMFRKCRVDSNCVVVPAGLCSCPEAVNQAWSIEALGRQKKGVQGGCGAMGVCHKDVSGAVCRKGQCELTWPGKVWKD